MDRPARRRRASMPIHTFSNTARRSRPSKAATMAAHWLAESSGGCGLRQGSAMQASPITCTWHQEGIQYVSGRSGTTMIGSQPRPAPAGSQALRGIMLATSTRAPHGMYKKLIFGLDTHPHRPRRPESIRSFTDKRMPASVKALLLGKVIVGIEYHTLERGCFPQIACDETGALERARRPTHRAGRQLIGPHPPSGIARNCAASILFVRRACHGVRHHQAAAPS